MSANNHYAGFGPGTANIFRKMVQLPEVKWEKEETEEEDKDTTTNIVRSATTITTAAAIINN